MKVHPRAQPILRVKSSALLDVSLSKASVEGSLTRIPRACSKGKRVQSAARTWFADIKLIEWWNSFPVCRCTAFWGVNSTGFGWQDGQQLDWKNGTPFYRCLAWGFMPSAGQLAHSPPGHGCQSFCVVLDFPTRIDSLPLHLTKLIQLDLWYRSILSMRIPWDFNIVSRHARTRLLPSSICVELPSFLFIEQQELMVGRCDLQNGGLKGIGTRRQLGASGPYGTAFYGAIPPTDTDTSY